MTSAHKNIVSLAILVAAVLLVAKPGPLLGLLTESPIPEPGLHVLILEESAQRTPELAAALNSGRWQALVESGNWRIVDAVEDDGRPRDLSQLEAKWQPAIAAWAKTVGAGGSPPLPWLVVSNAPHGGEAKPLVAAELVPTVEHWAKFGEP